MTAKFTPVGLEWLREIIGPNFPIEPPPAPNRRDVTVWVPPEMPEEEQRALLDRVLCDPRSVSTTVLILMEYSHPDCVAGRQACPDPKTRGEWETWHDRRGRWWEAPEDPFHGEPIADYCQRVQMSKEQLDLLLKNIRSDSLTWEGTGWIFRGERP